MVVIVVNFADSGCRPFPTNLLFNVLHPDAHFSHLATAILFNLTALCYASSQSHDTHHKHNVAYPGCSRWQSLLVCLSYLVLLSFPTRGTFGILRLSFGMFAHGMSSLNCWCSFRFDHVTCCRITIRICWYVGIDFGSRLFPLTLC